MKCRKLRFVNMSFLLVLLLVVSATKKIIFSVPAFFQSSFCKSNLCPDNFADLYLILECSLRSVLGLLSFFVVENSTIYSCEVDFIYFAFSWQSHIDIKESWHKDPIPRHSSVVRDNISGKKKQKTK